MKKFALIAALMLTLSACTGDRGVIGGQKVCTNNYLFGVISISQLFSPCAK